MKLKILSIICLLLLFIFNINYTNAKSIKENYCRIVYSNIRSVENKNKTYIKIGKNYKLKNLKKKGYVFLGWYDSKGKKLKSIKATKKNYKIYAKWRTIKSFKVTYFESNKKKISSKIYKNDKSIILKKLSKKGYKFLGWYDRKRKITKIKVGNRKNLKLYAKWKNDKKFKIKYYLNGGVNNSQNPKYLKFGKKLNLQNPTRTGYTFAGWYEKNNFKNRISSTIVKKSISIYAKWQVINYSIAYDYQGGNGGTNPSQYNINSNFSLTPAIKPNFQFLGWYDSLSGRQITYIDGRFKGNLALYAKWKRINKKIYSPSWVSSYHRGRIENNIHENTLEAIHAAKEAGANWVEIDIRETKDHVLVLSHDDVVYLQDSSRNSKVVTISQTNYDDIKNMVYVNSNNKVTTLEDALSYASVVGLKCNLDCKIVNNEVDEQIAKSVVNCNMSNNCIYSTYDTSLGLAVSILNIDKNAGFVFPASDYNIDFQKLGIDSKKIYLYCVADSMSEDVYNEVENNGYSLLISNVTDENYNIAMDYRPEMIEFLSNQDVRNLNDNYIDSQR